MIKLNQINYDNETLKSELIDIINKNIKELILSRKLSQQDITRAMGLTHGNISRYINNKTVPNTYKLYSLSKIFGVPMGYFFGEMSLERAERIRREKSRRDRLKNK